MLRRIAKKNIDDTHGFTVIESIISFTILTLALSGFSGMVVSSLQGFRLSQERFIAAKIAQEGMELAQNKKDNNVQCVGANPTCPLSNWQNNLIGDWEVESSETNRLLPTQQFSNFDSSRKICMVTTPPKDFGKFGYCGGSDYLSPQYTRKVSITSINSATISIKTTVDWGAGKSLTLESILFSDNEI